MEGRPLDDTELVERAKRGDVHAYEELVQRYQGLAHRVAYLVIGEAQEAEDASQEAFVKAYYALPRFRERSAFRPWLMKIVANEARNRKRSAGRRAGLALRAAGERPPGDAAPSPEGTALEFERNQALVDALNLLGEGDRLVVAYRYFLDLSEAEMAAALGCARGTVKSRLSRAMARLREALAEQAALAEAGD